MSVTLTPGQLRQVRETIETLSAIAAAGSSRGNSSTAFPTGTQRTPVTTTNNSLQRRETNNNLVSTSRLSADRQMGETTPAATVGDVSDNSASSSNVREVLSAANRCLTSINHRITNPSQHNSSRCRSGKRKAKEELTSLFRKKSSLRVKWKHKFVCLAKHSQRRLPTTDRDKDELYMAGLGEKEVEFFDLNMDAGEFRDLLYEYYPNLKDGGGYQFFKCTANTRTLESLSPATLSSPDVLKARVGNARTYIVPLQRDLDLTPIVDLPSGPTEQCLRCGEMFSLDDLSMHLNSCGASTSYTDDCVVDLTNAPSSQSDNDDFNIDDFGNEWNDENVGVYDDSSNDDHEVEREMIRVAVNNSLTSDTNRDRSNQRDADHVLSREIDSLKENINEDHDHALQVEVRRDFLLQDILREAQKNRFDPSKLIKITFIGEGAIDYGGPKREFFRIFSQEVGENYFKGQRGQPKFFRGDMLAVQKNEFYTLGVFVVLSIAYGNSGIPFLAEPVFDYISTNSYCMAIPESQIPDIELQRVVCQLNDADSDSELQEVASSDDVVDMIFATGFKKPLTSLTIADRGDLLHVILDFHLMSKVKSEMDQFVKSLGTFNFISIMQQNPKLWKPYFVYTERKLTAESIKEVFTLVEFSERGTIHRPLEEQTYVFFKEFLEECEDKKEEAGCSCTLEDILVFFSGAERVPPCGFGDTSPSLVFLHGNQMLPTASTCDLQMRLPIKHGDYTKFKDAMILGIKCHDGFGEP